MIMADNKMSLTNKAHNMTVFYRLQGVPITRARYTTKESSQGNFSRFKVRPPPIKSLLSPQDIF
jgi:hypothetical protein